MSKRRDDSAINIWAKIIIVCAGFIIGIALCRVFIMPFTVGDSSMEPAVKKGSRLLLSRFGSLKPGDIVLARHPNGGALLKRIAASGGSSVEIRNKVLYINNQKSELNIHSYFLDERNLPLSFTGRDTMTAVRLEKNEFFLIGDNRDRSYDSRELGAFTKSAIKGKVLYIFK